MNLWRKEEMKIKLTRKLLDKFIFATNQTPNKLKDFKHYEILTKNYGHGLGLIYCWDDNKEEGILFRFEHSEDREVVIDKTFEDVE